MRRSIVLFTRDLRVRDQRALLAAVRESEEVVPAFVLDRALLARSCGQPNRLAFLLEALRDLDASLRTRGARLVVLEGSGHTPQLEEPEAFYAAALPFLTAPA